MTHMVDSLLASPNGQGELPRKKDQARELQQRVEILKRLLMISRKQFEARYTYSLDDEKINYVKQMNEANDILDTLNVNDRYKNTDMRKVIKCPRSKI